MKGSNRRWDLTYSDSQHRAMVFPSDYSRILYLSKGNHRHLTIINFSRCSYQAKNFKEKLQIFLLCVSVCPCTHTSLCAHTYICMYIWGGWKRVLNVLELELQSIKVFTMGVELIFNSLYDKSSTQWQVSQVPCCLFSYYTVFFFFST